jgi:protein SCO1/2
MKLYARRCFLVAAALVCGLCVVIGAHCAEAQEVHAARGVVTAIDSAHRKVVISCDEIADYMAAMGMEFVAERPADLAPLRPGSVVAFDIVAAKKSSDDPLLARRIRIASSANLQSEPLQAGQLSMLHQAMSTERAIAVGQAVPDFALVDQAGKAVRLSDFRGKAVVLTFGYSRCPNPNYCLRLSNNLGKVQRRFPKGAGRDFVLLTIGIDPEHDRGETLARYAASFHANPDVWHFLTGPVLEIHRVAGLFGMNFWSEEGLVTHTLHTAVIGRDGTLLANLEGNAFTAEQLGDLLEQVIGKR